jgi:hypothetical protein
MAVGSTGIFALTNVLQASLVDRIALFGESQIARRLSWPLVEATHHRVDHIE